MFSTRKNLQDSVKGFDPPKKEGKKILHVYSRMIPNHNTRMPAEAGPYRDRKCSALVHRQFVIQQDGENHTVTTYYTADLFA